MTKHIVCESIYRLHMVKNKGVDNKVVFVFKRKTTLVVDNKRNSFVNDNTCLPAVSKSSISQLSLFLQRRKRGRHFLHNCHTQVVDK